MRVCVLLTVLFAFGTLKGVRSVIWPCEKDSDCRSVPTAICLNGNCRCPADKVFSPDFDKCLEAKFYGEDCKESVQCSHMPAGAKCSKGKCDCDEGLTYIRGRCRLLKVLGEDCEQNTDCWFGYDRESVECKDKKCSCAEGYYKRYANLCRRISMGVNHPCNVDEDCSAKENGLKCEKLKCVGGAKRRSSRDIASQTSFDYFGLNTVLEGEEQVQDDDIELKTISHETDTDTESAKKFGDECSKNGERCPGLFHSLCVENRCYCQLGYYPQDGLCIAEIGERAENQNLCKAKMAEYQEKTKLCVCRPYYFYEPNLRSCKKPIASIEAGCTSDLQCSPFGAAHCFQNATRKHCQCQPYARYNPSKQLCESKEGLGGHCDATKTCTVQHSVCSEQMCICAEKFIEKNNQCMPALGAKCTNSAECGNKHSECVQPPSKSNPSEGVCKCQVGFVEAKGECLKEASDFGDECVDSEQCKPLLGKLGQCINQTCICDEHHHLSFGKCEEKKVLGEKCSKASECFTPAESKTAECRNSVCHCQLGHTMDIEKQICIKPKKNSSGRPSCLKIITLLLIGSAILITSAAIKQAYF